MWLLCSINVSVFKTRCQFICFIYGFSYEVLPKCTSLHQTREDCAGPCPSVKPQQHSSSKPKNTDDEQPLPAASRQAFNISTNGLIVLSFASVMSPAEHIFLQQRVFEMSPSTRGFLAQHDFEMKREMSTFCDVTFPAALKHLMHSY